MICHVNIRITCILHLYVCGADSFINPNCDGTFVNLTGTFEISCNFKTTDCNFRNVTETFEKLTTNFEISLQLFFFTISCCNLKYECIFLQTRECRFLLFVEFASRFKL